MAKGLKLASNSKIDFKKRFLTDVCEGLKAKPKILPSKYFYDQKGDELFQQIMQLEEYYLTRCEQEIFESQHEQIAAFIKRKKRLRIIELGAGDGQKSIPFLKKLSIDGLDFDYVPVDISAEVLNKLKQSFKEELPLSPIHPFSGDYFHLHFPEYDGPTAWMYMGSNIGNLSDLKTHHLLQHLRDSAKKGDTLIIGYDLKKDPNMIRAAYNDSSGVTSAFNLNLLQRINNELGANFDLNKWQHYPTYDVLAGEARSYLVSKKKQEVQIGQNGAVFSFEPWEAIRTEISRKYAPKQIASICKRASWSFQKTMTDSNNYYALGFYEAI